MNSFYFHVIKNWVKASLVLYTRELKEDKAAFTPGNMLLGNMLLVAGNMLPVSRQHVVCSNRWATNWQQFCCRQHVASSNMLKATCCRATCCLV